MRFLRKSAAELESLRFLSYARKADRDAARGHLVVLQRGYCAYSERYLKPLDSVEIEHFDPRLKHTERDGIANWHAVLRWMNAHKARIIEPYLPLPATDDDSLDRRIRYERGEFTCDPADHEARHLIEFLGVNRPEVVHERNNHVSRVRRLRDLCERHGDDFVSLLVDSPEDLSFSSALEAELGIPAFRLIEEGRQRNGRNMTRADGVSAQD